MPDATREIPCNCLAVRQAARQLTQLYDNELAGTGLRVTQYSLLAVLSRIGPATMQELADALVLDRTTLTHNLKPLERDNLIAINMDKADRRTRRLELTRQGVATLKAARTAWKRAQDRFENAFGSEDAAALRKQLARLVASVP